MNLEWPLQRVTVLEIHEVYEYAVTQYDTASGEGGLFVEYINTFLKLKAEASGFPSWVRSPSDEERYIEEFRQSEGITLNKDSLITPQSADLLNSVSTHSGVNYARILFALKNN